MSLHEHLKIFQGGLSLETIAYSSLSHHAVFRDWSHACGPLGLTMRLETQRLYYFKSKKTSSFEELIFADWQAFVLIYADLVSTLNYDD